MVNQAVICVALSHRTSRAVSTLVESEVFTILAVAPDWRFGPWMVRATSGWYVKVGLTLVRPCESEEVVVAEGFGEP